MDDDRCRAPACLGQVYRPVYLGLKDRDGKPIVIPYVYCQDHVTMILTKRWDPT